MNDFYVLIDFSLKQIITPIGELPVDWSNICGLNIIDDEKIKDLSWAGHKNLGWFNIKDSNLTEYEISNDWLESSKLKLKSLIATQRWEKETEILTFHEKQFKVDYRTKLSLFSTSFSFEQDKIINWKFLNGTYEMSYLELKELYNFIISYVQKCFDVEYELSKLIDNTETKDDLFNLDLNLVWPSTILQLI